MTVVRSNELLYMGLDFLNNPGGLNGKAILVEMSSENSKDVGR